MKLAETHVFFLATAVLAGLMLTSCTAHVPEPASAESPRDASSSASQPAGAESDQTESLTGEDAVAEGVEVPDGVNLDEVYVDPARGPLTQAEVDSLNPANELVVECSDPEALAASEGHDPAGWPQDWDGEGAMPNPECHPDFIEVRKWGKFEEFHACWEGIETSTAVRTSDMTDADTYRILWDQSRARADWEWSDYGTPPELATDECWDAYERNTAGA